MLYLIVAVAATLTALWKLTQLIRAPSDRGLQVATTCTLFVAFALLAQYFTAGLATASQAAEAVGKLAQFVLISWFFCALILLLQSALRPDLLARWGWVEVALAAFADVLLLVAYTAAPEGATWIYSPGPLAGPVLVFYLFGNVYLLYACLRGTWLAWTANARVPRAVSVSLRIAAVGLLVNAVFVHAVRVASSASRIATDRSIVPYVVDARSQAALTVGIVLFSVGIAYPGLRTALIKARLWVRERRRYRALYRLWAALFKAFPAIALDGAIGPHRDRAVVLRLRLRYYRRLIECRDGLMHLSPYLTEPADADGPYSMQLQARMVVQALRRRYRGDRPTGGVVAIAAPTGSDPEDDARQLVRLAQAFNDVDPLKTV